MCVCDRPDDFEDGVPVAQLVGLDVGVGQSSPQLPHRVLAAQIRHGGRTLTPQETHNVYHIKLHTHTISHTDFSQKTDTTGTFDRNEDDKRFGTK